MLVVSCLKYGQTGKGLILVPEISGPSNLAGKVAIVTGASRGIGKAIVKSLATSGAYVGLIDISSCDETLDSINYKNNAVAIRCDITNSDETRNSLDKIISHFGKIDILVNNAGMLGSCGKELEEFSLDEWNKLLNTNLTGTFLVTKQVWPYMKKAGQGKIICVGSIAGKIGGLFAGPHYCSSKGGVHSFVKWAAKNGAKYGILVNGVAPGPIATDMIKNEKQINDSMVPIGRLGQPEDIAEAVSFLSSQQSNFITGCVLNVTGGLLID
jgi:3-oxoacyl-[acyl-carrier protein] reductase